MSRSALMAMGSMDAVGGAQYVNRLLHEVLLGLNYDVRCRTLNDGPSFGPPSVARLLRQVRFVLGAQLDRRWCPALLLADHARVAYKAGLFRAQRASKVVFAHGVEAWSCYDRRVKDTFLRSDLVLCNSQFTRRKIIEMYRLDPGRCVHVALGVDPARPDCVPVKQRTQDFIVLGRVVVGNRYKGHDQLLQAWPYVVEKVPHAVLRVVGDGDDLERLKSIAAQLSLGGTVRFEGLVDEDRKHELLRRARGLFMLSTGEGFGLASAEAMALGTPVVGLEDTVTAELISHNVEGLLLPDRGTLTIMAAVQALTEDPQHWQRMSTAAHERWRGNFSRAACKQRIREALMARLPELSGQDLQ